MRIGITTYWTSNNNYGQLLQCWALQQFLKTNGHHPFLIRFLLYSEKPEHTLYSAIKLFFTRCLKIIFIYPIYQSYKKRKQEKLDSLFKEKDKQRDFDGFRMNHLLKTEIVYDDYSALLMNPPTADIYMCGSDQIWNFNLHPNNLNPFFLQFGSESIKRIAYAPSIGRDYWPKERLDELKRYLSCFNYISLREEPGVKICKDLGFDAKHVLDPTLLLKKEDYETLEDDSFKNESSYIFIYGVNYKTKEDINFGRIIDYANKNGLRIIVTNGSGYTPCREIFDGVEYVYATIPRWLSLIANAELVITPSFHGTVFSILYHKHLMYTPLKGSLSRGNSRVLGLLNDLGLNCLIQNDKKNISEYINQKIDWLKTDKLLDEKRNSSVDFITNAICN
jgi:hypothetical protein